MSWFKSIWNKLKYVFLTKTTPLIEDEGGYTDPGHDLATDQHHDEPEVEGFKAYPILSWEKKPYGKPENKSWTITLVDLIRNPEVFDVFMKAKDLNRLHADFGLLSYTEKLHVFAELFSSMAFFESTWRPSVFVKGTTGSSDKNTYACGLLQMGVIDQKGFGTGTKYTFEELCTVRANLDTAIKIMKNQILKKGVFIIKKTGSVSRDGVFWAVIYEGGKYSDLNDILKSTNSCV